jgi:hypothetical protein
MYGTALVKSRKMTGSIAKHYRGGWGRRGKDDRKKIHCHRWPRDYKNLNLKLVWMLMFFRRHCTSFAHFYFENYRGAAREGFSCFLKRNIPRHGRRCGGTPDHGHPLKQEIFLFFKFIFCFFLKFLENLRFFISLRYFAVLM